MEVLEQSIKELRAKVDRNNKISTGKQKKIHEYRGLVEGLKEDKSKLDNENKVFNDKIIILKVIGIILDEWRGGVESIFGGELLAKLMFDSTPAKLIQVLGLGTVEKIMDASPDVILGLLGKYGDFLELFYRKLEEQGWTLQTTSN